MSSRQMRRLQQLVATSTGADGDEDGDYGMPATMKPAGGKPKKNKKNAKSKGLEATVEVDAEAAAAVEETQRVDDIIEGRSSGSSHASLDAAAAAAAAEEEQRRKKEKRDKKRAKKKPGESSPDGSPSGSPVTRTGGRRQQQQQQATATKSSKRRMEEDAEEEALLEAALAARRLADGDDGYNEEEADCDEDVVLLNLMMRADAKRLDMRGERIRNFGLKAVEDVGDGAGHRHRADGRGRDTGSTSFFPEHGGRVKFRACAFATPNRYRWPPYDNMGTALTVLPSQNPVAFWTDRAWRSDPGEPEAVLYQYDSDSPAFLRAEEERERCVASMAPVQALVDCLTTYGCYHVPTLLQLSDTLALTGSTAHAQELVDLALYHVGMVLSHTRLEGTWAQRQIHGMQRQIRAPDGQHLTLPLCAGNPLIFEVLRRGVHVALRRGCTRTAWEMAKFTLSLDPLDPATMLLQVDYLALRSKRWVWLIKVYTLSTRRLAGGSSAGSRGAAELLEALFQARCSPEKAVLSYSDMAGALALDICRMPGFAFGAALARHFLAREAAREAEVVGSPASANEGGGGGRYRSKVLRDMTPAESELLAAAPSAEDMLAAAVVSFPHAAAALVETLPGGIEGVCRGASVDPYWASDLVPRVAEETAAPAAALFAARHGDLWKAPETVGFLRSVLSTPTSTGDGESRLTAAAGRELGWRLELFGGEGATSVTRLFYPRLLMRNYEDVTPDELLGTTAAAIPADLLRPDMDDDEDADPLAHAEAILRGRVLDEADRDALLRLDALYGGEGSGDRERLAAHRARFVREPEAQAVLAGINPLHMFLYTLMPMTSPEEVALRSLLERRGIADPVRVRERGERAANERIWADDEAAAEVAEDSDADWRSMESASDNYDGDHDDTDSDDKDDEEGVDEAAVVDAAN